MKRHPPGDDKNDPARYIRKIDDRYILDPLTGIYKPKSHYEETRARNLEEDRHWYSRLWGNFKRHPVSVIINLLTLVVVGIYTHYARLQWFEAQRTANAAIHANELTKQAINNSKDQFRTDQRPYITLAGAGDVVPVRVVPEGEHAGHLAVELHLTNYGKSPGIETARDARLAIGSTAAKRIRLHEAVDRRGRIIPPGDKPSIYAYSDGAVPPQILNDIKAGKVLVIAYGHVEYTDMLGKPKPQYTSEFCAAILASPDNSREADKNCKTHTRME